MVRADPELELQSANPRAHGSLRPRKAGANQWVIASKHEIVLPFDEANERGNLFERREQRQQPEVVTAVRECDIGDANP